MPFFGADEIDILKVAPMGTTDKNLYAYCDGNPVNREDVTGNLWSSLCECVRMTAAEFGRITVGLSPAYMGLGGVAVADGPLPVGDVIAISGIALLAVGTASYSIYQTIEYSCVYKTKAEAKANIKYVTAEKIESNRCKLIYRYGGTSMDKLVPTDIDRIKNSGLSFSVIPKPGSFVTSIELLNSTGYLLADKDGDTHVSVYPLGGSIEEWYRLGIKSIWTQTIWENGVVWEE